MLLSQRWPSIGQIRLFGSLLTRGFHADSDLDLLVEVQMRADDLPGTQVGKLLGANLRAWGHGAGPDGALLGQARQGAWLEALSDEEHLLKHG